MAKKSTTGGPRPRRTTAEDIQRRKEYKSRSEREKMWQRRAVIAIGAMIALSLIVLLVAVVYEQLIVPNQAISTVNGKEIKTSDFQDRVRFARWQMAEEAKNVYYYYTLQLQDSDGANNALNSYISQLDSPSIVGSQILQEMEEQILLEAEVEARGLTVDETTIDAQVDDFMSTYYGVNQLPDENAIPTLAPTLTPTPLVSPTPRPSATPLPTEIPATEEAAPEGDETDAADTEATDEPADEPAGDADTTDEPTEEPTAEATVEPTVVPTLAPTEIRATLDSVSDSYFDTATDAAGISRSTVRDAFTYNALAEAVRNDMLSAIPTEEFQVNVRHILLAYVPESPGAVTAPTDAQIEDANLRYEQAMAALRDGEPFASVAALFSNDAGESGSGGSAANGGELGWANPEDFDPAFRDAVVNAEVGAIVGPVESQFGIHIIQVLEKDDAHPLTEAVRGERASQEFQQWLGEARAAADIDRRDDWLDRVPDKPSVQRLFGDFLG